MESGALPPSLATRLDRLYEFERAPVTRDRLQGFSRFAGLYAGEHVAATEFVIGALFVSWGARTGDVLWGLLLGNLAAVLSWALVCAPIATRTRLTLYWYLRRIAGPAVTAIYNVLNALLYCVLAGAMITVSASAVRLPFGIPAQTHWYPGDLRFVGIVLLVGGVVTALAIWGFKSLARFASICSPWMIVVFVAGALATLPGLARSVPGIGRITSLGDLLELADRRIWTGVAAGGARPIGLWHVAAFAWICNIAMHLGLSDMAILRYACHGSYGFASAFGMFLGHYLAWICAGIMGAAAALAAGSPLTELDSGAVAYHAAGVAGAVAVVVAGWTTSNPTLYRAGLALQAVTPNWPRWKVTLVAGTITTLVACSPFVFTRLLDFVGTYGVLLAPVGGIVTAEHALFERLGLRRYWAAGHRLNAPALAAWAIASLGAVVLWQLGLVHLFFLAVPAWALAGLLYTLFAALAGAAGRTITREATGDPGVRGEAAGVAPGAPPPRDRVPPTSPPPRRASIFEGAGLLAVLLLAACVALALWVFLAPPGTHIERLGRYHVWMIWLSLGYFVAAITYAARRNAA